MPVTRRKQNLIEKIQGTSYAKNLDLHLPDAPCEANKNLTDFSYLIHGEPGVGKTTFGMQFPKALIFQFEPGAKSHTAYKVNITKWEEFVGYIDLLDVDDSGKFETVVIDTGAMAYQMCWEYSCAQMGITDPNDKGWAAGWKFIEREFKNAHYKILRKFGLVVIAHSEIKELKQKVGSQLMVTGEKLKIQIGNQGIRLYNAIIDVVGYYQKRKDGRYLIIQDSDVADGKQRIKNHFLSVNGEALTDIYMGESEEAAFVNFQKAFNNQIDPSKKIRRKS